MTSSAQFPSYHCDKCGMEFSNIVELEDHKRQLNHWVYLAWYRLTINKLKMSLQISYKWLECGY